MTLTTAKIDTTAIRDGTWHGWRFSHHRPDNTELLVVEGDGGFWFIERDKINSGWWCLDDD